MCSAAATKLYVGRHVELAHQGMPGQIRVAGQCFGLLAGDAGAIRELRCDTMVLTAATEAETVRSALSAGALSYLVKPFMHADLAARLAGYARYRRILAKSNLGAHDVDAALEALRPRAAAPRPAVVSSPTKRLVLQALRASPTPMSSGEVATAVGISRATAQRYLAALATTGEVTMRLRYGTTGRPEQEFSVTSDGSSTHAR